MNPVRQDWFLGTHQTAPPEETHRGRRGHLMEVRDEVPRGGGGGRRLEAVRRAAEGEEEGGAGGP